jgi:hypothetical protein
VNSNYDFCNAVQGLFAERERREKKIDEDMTNWEKI